MTRVTQTTIDLTLDRVTLWKPPVPSDGLLVNCDPGQFVYSGILVPLTHPSTPRPTEGRRTPIALQSTPTGHKHHSGHDTRMMTSYDNMIYTPKSKVYFSLFRKLVVLSMLCRKGNAIAYANKKWISSSDTKTHYSVILRVQR